MRAAVFHAQEDLRVEDVEEPTPGPGQVKLRNGYSGICGSGNLLLRSAVQKSPPPTINPATWVP